MSYLNKIYTLASFYDGKYFLFIKIARIKKMPSGKYRVISEKGKNLGEYNSNAGAEKRLREVEYFKHKDSNNIEEKSKEIDLTKADDFSYSAIMRCLVSQCSKDQVLTFLKIFKLYFDKGVKANAQKPEKAALHNALIKFNKIYPIKINKKLVKKASIEKFQEVVSGKLFRGGQPSIDDVISLKKNFNINKIISLDEMAGSHIDEICKSLHINHVMIPIDGTRQSLLNLFKYDLKDLLLNGCPTFVHCQAGKDRTGLLIALFKCKYMGMNPEDAIKEARSLGLGLDIDPKITNLFEKLIRDCATSSGDINNADIVSNEREYISDNRSSPLDEARQQSFAPMMSTTRQYPYDYVYNEINNQSGSRGDSKINYNKNINKRNNAEPLVGQYNNAAGTFGVGPVFPAGGFIYD